jgi:hypothetical protein
MIETEVLLKTHRFLRSQNLDQQSVVRLFTDAHSTLLPHKALAPFQRFTLDMGDFVMHPDLVGQLSDGESVFAIEAKGDSDLLKGLIQAEMYQTGFHYAFLAADAAALGTSLVDFAKRKNVGIIAVSDNARLAHLPKAHMPMRDAFRFIARQMESVIQVSYGETFHFNIPTHYLVWAIALQPNVTYSLATLPSELANYPMPKEWRSAVRGGQKLGLVRILGDTFQLTAIGSAVKDILPSSVSEWTRVHRTIGARGRGIALAEYQPQSAAVLRFLLLQDAIVRLVVEGLQSFSTKSANFAELAVACDQLDHARAPIFFLKPDAVVLLADDRGMVHWELAKGEHYRSSTFNQYKSVLKHAGLLKATKLGGATAKGYEPTQDMWELV